MTLVGQVDEKGNAQIEFPSGDIIKRLEPVAGQPLHFSIKGDAEHQYIPYYEVGDNSFTCYPAIGMAKK